ncbi:MAG: bifunctional deaminase-reductase domain protein, partial [Frankiales bacterium]|nr:bifunctional deaminase-reductase domain protein [Frankiales bacterium]
MELLVPERRADPDLRALYDVGGPYVRGGMLQSADGTVAHDGSSRPLQRPGDLLVFRTLRQVADVVLVGAGTARDEDYGPVVLDAAARAWRA